MGILDKEAKEELIGQTITVLYGQGKLKSNSRLSGIALSNF